MGSILLHVVQFVEGFWDSINEQLGTVPHPVIETLIIWKATVLSPTIPDQNNRTQMHVIVLPEKYD